MRLSSAFTQKGTDKNVEEVVILKAELSVLKVAIVEFSHMQNYYDVI